MTTSIAQLRDSIEFSPGLPWLTEQVYAQREAYYPHRWRDNWPSEAGSIPARLQGSDATAERKVRMTRQDIFEAASGVETAADALNLYVFMCGWGAGTSGLAVTRSMKPLRESGLAKKLLGSLLAIRSGDDPVTVYDELRKEKGHYRVRSFGPAFFTKWLYFAAYKDTTDSIQPLILDSRVSEALGWPKSHDSQWHKGEYEEYLNLALELARNMHTTPHVIEHALFYLRSDATKAPTWPSVSIAGLTDSEALTLRELADEAGQPLGVYMRRVIKEAISR